MEQKQSHRQWRPWEKVHRNVVSSLLSRLWRQKRGARDFLGAGLDGCRAEGRCNTCGKQCAQGQAGNCSYQHGPACLIGFNLSPGRKAGRSLVYIGNE